MLLKETNAVHSDVGSWTDPLMDLCILKVLGMDLVHGKSTGIRHPLVFSHTFLLVFPKTIELRIA